MQLLKAPTSNAFSVFSYHISYVVHLPLGKFLTVPANESLRSICNRFFILCHAVYLVMHRLLSYLYKRVSLANIKVIMCAKPHPTMLLGLLVIYI